ncbi:hypothetical protein SH580_17605 [Coraliomargarita algicola]|uniref:Uncharacterized protein n=1 Tax=Coraliomargarita algicola TaxID=3092156 RepID=A0ABZ0RJ91_9BACT|nr:hypothetical protein [Coraliomargarita sp. J2-16]WPJ95241.1 hypothetical protein SH580_17605 [Coraliomargarita sp. J2-16]
MKENHMEINSKCSNFRNFELRFSALKQEAKTPEFSCKQSFSSSFDCGSAKLELKGETGTYLVEIFEIVATTSGFQPSLNGQYVDALYRTEWLIHSDVGIVRIALNKDLLQPRANRRLSESLWNYHVWAETMDGTCFEDYKLMSNLPCFDSIVPSADDFERLVDPSSETEINPFRVFAGVAVSALLGLDWREYFELNVSREGKPNIHLADVFSIGLYPVKLESPYCN